MIRALVIDDEPLARRLLVTLLREHTDVEVVGQATGGHDAVRQIQALAPDLVFLDVQMPGLDGFEVLAALEMERLPEVIFVTAFDQYALRAFEVQALDYLLKPFDEERLAAALARTRRRLEVPGDADSTQRILAMLQHMQRREQYVERLVIKVGEKVFLQDVQEIDRIEADGKYLRIHVGKQVHVIRETVSRITALLDPDQFVRISRSDIVNVRRIREIQPWFRGEYVVVMKDATQVTTTRSHRDALKRLLEYGAAGGTVGS